MGLSLIVVLALVTLGSSSRTGNNKTNGHPVIAVNYTSSSSVGLPLDGFVSYSIEFSSFPDFAGNISHPNTFSSNLLNNIALYTGTKPYIRVGGNTQDYAIFNASLPQATYGIIDPAKSPDYPTTLQIGPSFFESYSTFPGTRYIHGFNLAKNGSVARNALLASVPYACHALENGKLAHWELGNEPDLYKTSSQGPVRPVSWNESDYVSEWLNGTRVIRAAMALEAACPNLTTQALYTHYAPSFGGTANSLSAVKTFRAGLDQDADIALISSHNYISGATSPGVTLQDTLMNHDVIVASVAKQIAEFEALKALSGALEPGLRFVLGETNSLYNQGKPGLSDSFGAALWGVDFGLWCASQGIGRVHFHQGTNYRYASWQPLTTNLSATATKAPYYGNVAMAAFLGNESYIYNPNTSTSTSTNITTSVVNLPLEDRREAAYAAYVGGRLRRLMVVDMHAYNASSSSNESEVVAAMRPVTMYTFKLSSWKHEGHKLEDEGVTEVDVESALCANSNQRLEGRLRRLMAPGSDSVSGVTFDGWSYDWEVGGGLPVRLGNVTVGESVGVKFEGKRKKSGGRGGKGELVIKAEVPWSSAVIVDLVCM